MNKPEDISQDAWDAVVKASSFARSLANSEASETFVRADFARAVMAAEKRGEEREREAILALGSEYVWDDHALAQATDIGRAVHHQSVEIVEAIRKRGA